MFDFTKLYPLHSIILIDRICPILLKENWNLHVQESPLFLTSGRLSICQNGEREQTFSLQWFHARFELQKTYWTRFNAFVCRNLCLLKSFIYFFKLHAWNLSFVFHIVLLSPFHSSPTITATQNGYVFLFLY